MRALFDVNALLALLDPQHTFHSTIWAWWATNEKSGWATCLITQNGVARIMSQPRYSNPITTMDAIRLVEIGVRQPGHAFWPADISITDEQLFDRSQILGPNQVADVYVLGLTVKNGGRLVTFDRSVPLGAVRGVEARHLVVL